MASNTYTHDQASRLALRNNGITTMDYGYCRVGGSDAGRNTTCTYDARDHLTSDGAKVLTASGGLVAIGKLANGQKVAAAGKD